GMTLYNLSVMRHNARDYEAALEAAREALPHERLLVVQSPEEPPHRRMVSSVLGMMARCHQLAGRLDEAELYALGRWRGGPEDGVPSSLVAQEMAWLTGKATDDRKRRYRQQALSALRVAVEQGFRDLKRLDGDPAFRALRGQAEFEAVRGRLASRIQ